MTDLSEAENEDTKKAEAPEEETQPNIETIYMLEVETKEGKKVQQQVSTLDEGHRAGVRAVESGVFTFPIPGGVQVVTCSTAKVYNRPAPTTPQA